MIYVTKEYSKYKLLFVLRTVVDLTLDFYEGVFTRTIKIIKVVLLRERGENLLKVQAKRYLCQDVGLCVNISFQYRTNNRVEINKDW